MIFNDFKKDVDNVPLPIGVLDLDDRISIHLEKAMNKVQTDINPISTSSHFWDKVHSTHKLVELSIKCLGKKTEEVKNKNLEENWSKAINYIFGQYMKFKDDLYLSDSPGVNLLSIVLEEMEENSIEVTEPLDDDIWLKAIILFEKKIVSTSSMQCYLACHYKMRLGSAVSH